MTRQHGRPLCRVSDFPDAGARGIETLTERCEHGIFIVKRGAGFYAYLNRCPHARLPLNWTPDVFMDADGCYIQCANHGALFRVEDGVCVAGPCAGERLTPVAVERLGDEVRLAETG